MVKFIAFFAVISFSLFFPIGDVCATEGGDGGDRDSGPSLEMPPTLLPSMDPSKIDPEKLKGLTGMNPELKRENEAVARLVQKGRLQSLNRKMDRAHEANAKADKNVKIAETVGMIDAAAAAAVGAWAPAAAAATIGTIGIVGDGLAAAAGSLTKSYLDKKKSFKQSVKDATGDAIGKSVMSGLTSKIKTGAKVTDATLGFISGQMYDNSSPNLEE